MAHRGTGSRAFAATAAVSIGLVAATGRADGPAACGGSEALRARVAEMVGRAPSEPIELFFLSATGQIRTRVAVKMAGEAPRERVLSGPTCGAVMDAAAVFVALAVHPTSRSAQTSGALSLTAATPGAVPVWRADDLTPPHAGRSARPPLRARAGAAPRKMPWAVQVGGVAEAGTLPGVGVGVRLGLARTFDRIRIDVGADYLAPRQRNLEGEPDKGGTFDRFGLALDGGARMTGEPAEVRGSLGIGLGALRGRGRGLDQPRTPASIWMGLRGGLTLSLRATSRLVPFVDVRGIVSLLRRPFSIDGRGRVFVPGPIGFEGTAGLEVRL